VDVGLNEPQDPAGAQLQLTAELFDTVADTFVVPPKVIVAGGACEKDTEVGCKPAPEYEAPPQPDRNASASARRMSGFRMTPPQADCVFSRIDINPLNNPKLALTCCPAFLLKAGLASTRGNRETVRSNHLARSAV